MSRDTRSNRWRAALPIRHNESALPQMHEVCARWAWSSSSIDEEQDGPVEQSTRRDVEAQSSG